MSDSVKLIGICLSTIHEEDRFYFIQTFNRYACENGYRLLIFNTCSDLYEANSISDAGEVAVFELIPYEQLSALIVFPYFLQNEFTISHVVEQCHAYHVPMISIDKELEGSTSFFFSYGTTFEEICLHVIRQHHAQNIFMMAGLRDNDFSDTRIQAFRRALETEGIPFSQENVGYGDFWEGPTNTTMYRWFIEEKREMPDAIICANDTMAITVSSWLQEHGYQVPEDCIVTGFDGIMQANYHIPHLTTCHQDYEKMAEQLMKAIQEMSAGKEWPQKTEIPFHVRISQSCGCKPVSAEGVNTAVQSLIDRVMHYRNRQTMLCRAQASISNMSNIAELPTILIESFAFHTNVIAINDDMFREPKFGEMHKSEQAFTELLNVIYQRYFWKEYSPCIVSRHALIPQPELMIEKKEPILVCAIHFLDLVFGYCVFQPDMNIDEYIKMHTLMIALGSSLGSFHGKVQIKAINNRLVSVNDELERLYIHDHMTGLFNRRGFYRHFHSQLTENLGKSVSVILISADLDGLKPINDTYGHLEGDNAISTVGKALQSCAIQGEICARFGGDEFMAAGIIATRQQDAYFEGFQNRFKAYLEQYNRFSGKPYQVEASIGFSSEPLTSDFDLDKMIKIADDRMYADKVARKKARR